MKTENNESIIETIQKRMDDPNYIPTGPTYGEWLESKTKDAVLVERERYAKIAEEFADTGMGRAAYECANDIAAAIRSGK